MSKTIVVVKLKFLSPKNGISIVENFLNGVKKLLSREKLSQKNDLKNYAMEKIFEDEKIVKKCMPKKNYKNSGK